MDLMIQLNEEHINVNKITKGRIKCREKNRFNVALLIENHQCKELLIINL